MAKPRGVQDLEAARRREFRRTVVVSALAHLGVVGLAVAVPAPASVTPPGVIAVELVAAPPSPAAPQATPAPPQPAAAPKPRAPKPKQVVLPKKPTERASKPEPKPKPKAEPAKPKPKRREVFLEPEPKKEMSLEDLMAEMREERGEATPAPKPVETSTARVPSPGAGRPVSPQVLDWVRRAKVHVQQSWVVSPGFRMQDLETHVIVKLDGGGNVVGTPKVTRRSGNPWYDEGVVRGIEKASPLPAPPEAGEWPFVFVPEDAF